MRKSDTKIYSHITGASSLSTKITAMICFMIIISTLTVGIFSYVVYRRDSINQQSERAAAIAQSLAAAIDSYEFLEITETGEINDYYMALQRFFDNVKHDTGAYFVFAGTVVDGSGLRIFMEGLLPEENHVAGFNAILPSEIFPLGLFNIQGQGNVYTSGLIPSGIEGFGYVVAAYAPIFDSAGRVVGVVGINISASQVLASSNNFALMIAAIVMGVILILIWIPVFFLRQKFSKPINGLISLLREVRDGKIDINMDKARITGDELGVLAGDVYALVDVIKSILNDLGKLNHEISERGDIDYRVKTESYNGAYQKVLMESNAIVDSLVSVMQVLYTKIKSDADGDPDAFITKTFPGKMRKFTDVMQESEDVLMSLYLAVSDFSQRASQGNFDKTIDTSEFKGVWVNMFNLLNSIASSVKAPMLEIGDVMHRLGEEGYLDKRITGSYSGEFLTIKNAINSTMDNLSDVVRDVSQTLTDMSAGDLTAHISELYPGDFAAIRESINTISITLNKTMSEISASAGQVLSGANQISFTSTNLASGASEQAALKNSLAHLRY